MKIEIREDVEETVAWEAEHRNRGAERGGHAGRARVWSSRGSRVSRGQRRKGRAGVMDGHITFTRKEGKSNGSKNKVFRCSKVHTRLGSRLVHVASSIS